MSRKVTNSELFQLRNDIQALTAELRARQRRLKTTELALARIIALLQSTLCS